MSRILISECTDFSPSARQRLEQVGEVRACDLDRASLLREVRDADVLWVRLRHRIDSEVLAAAPALRIIASPTTGLDHIDLDAASARGITVISLRDAGAFLKDIRATAELTIGLMLNALRHISAATRSVEHGQWDRDSFKGHELRGRTVGIVGYGRLGRLVAGYLRAFGTELVAADPAGGDDVEIVALDELLARADLVTLHVHLTERTRGLIGARELAIMRPGALLVNTSRGGLIDEVALLAALESGQLWGAALDVLDGESASGVEHLPLVAYARTHANLTITPHIGGCTYESMRQTENYLAECVCAALSRK